MLRCVQTVGWSLLPCQPVHLDGPVVGVLGRNGSGKSSFLDAVKVLLGCRRFGQGRTAAHYRFQGRAGQPAAQRAYVLGVLDAADRLDAHSGPVTLVCEITATGRRYLLLDGERLFDERDPWGAAAALRQEYPANRWLRPEQWADRVLTPLGVGAAVRRLLELPQGELARALDRDPAQLAGLLIELCGGQDAQRRFRAAHDALLDARERHREARRRHDRARADLAEAHAHAADSRHAQARRRDLAALARSARDLCARAGRAPAGGIIAWEVLSTAGIDVTVTPDGRVAVAGHHAERAALLLGPGELLPTTAVTGAVGEGWVSGPRTEQVPARALVSPPQHVALRRLLADAERHDLLDREPPPDPDRRRTEEHADAAGLLGAWRALSANGIPDAPDPAEQQRLAVLQAAVDADRHELDRRQQLLTDCQAGLSEAAALYRHAVGRALNGAADRFADICQDAGLPGRMDLVLDGAEGAQVHLWAAERAGEPLRSLQSQDGGSLSGGWRTTVLTLAVVACLDTGTGLPVLPLDELGASLDEQRLIELGRAFARLGERRGLQTLISLPTRQATLAVAEFAAQQLAFFRPQPDEPFAPAPHSVTVSAQLAAP